MGQRPCTYDGDVMSTTAEEANHDGSDDVRSDPVRRDSGVPPRRESERGELQAVGTPQRDVTSKAWESVGRSLSSAMQTEGRSQASSRRSS